MSATSIRRVDEKNESYGAGLFATKDIEAGGLITTVKSPVISVLDSARLEDTCYACHKQQGEAVKTSLDSTTTALELSPSNLKICTGCRVVRYCNQECQTNSWNQIHKHECKIFKNLRPKVLPHNVRAVMQLLHMKDRKLISENEWNDFLACPSHRQHIENNGNQQWMDLLLVARATIGYTRTKQSYETVLELFCRLGINSITLMTPFFDPIGLAWHPYIAKINHSCQPNAYVRFPSDSDKLGAIRVEAIRPIETDEEIAITYIDENDMYQHRQQALRDRYFFNCRCPKCTNNISQQTLKNKDQTQITAQKEEADLMRQSSTLIADANKSTDRAETIEKLRSALHLLLSNKDRQVGQAPFPEALQKLVVAYVDGAQYNLAFAHAAIQYFDVDTVIYPSKHHPIRAVHTFVLLRLATAIASTGVESHADFQKLDAAPYGLNLSWWKAYLVHELKLNTAWVLAEEAASTGGPEYDLQAAYGGVSAESLESSKDYDAAFGPMRKVMDDMYELLKKEPAA